ncbi:nucleotide sugar dehydrogenase [Saccharicrinis sp. FJH62]|uniref:nucleotide sugar dehydrogenase n=1 Tax=Saccharicrinis sp. FJH62 TaxID=3344657 RepID=UPI0035D469E8
MNNWKVEKIGVVGPGIVGMPMAALLADAKIKIGTNQPAKVVVIQRNSENSGWKVDAINSGKSVIGGIEPELNDIVEKSVKEGILSASHDFNDIVDADLILVSIQTDKKGLEPDYGPMLGGLTSLAEALQNKPAYKKPIIVFESTLAPSSMMTVMKDHFAKFGLVEGKDILLGNSPNRVMPGRLVERVAASDKLIGGLQPETPRMIKEVYSHIVKKGTLFTTNSLTAEIEKTLENAYRDVRIAFSAEIVRYCDDHNINFFRLRDSINNRLSQSDNATADPNAVPSGGLLIPMIGVGGHCLPKDGILLWWRKIEKEHNSTNSLIVGSRAINDEAPLKSIELAERTFGSLNSKKIVLLGAAYRFNSEDTRNSPTLELAKLLIEKGCSVTIHDPFVKPDDQNLMKYGFESIFTNDFDTALNNAEYTFLCTSHKYYLDHADAVISNKSNKGIFDGCNIYNSETVRKLEIPYCGIGRGQEEPSDEFVEFVFNSFLACETGVANEVKSLIDFLNSHYADTEFNKAKFKDVQHLASTCSTGCEIVNPGKIEQIYSYHKFQSKLVEYAYNAQISPVIETL